MTIQEHPDMLQQLKDARAAIYQAQKGYDSAMDLLAKAEAALANAKSTADQALSAKIDAQLKLDSVFHQFKNESAEG